MKADQAAMIALPHYMDFVLKKDEDGIWRKYEYSFMDCDFSKKTNETFENFEEASEYMTWLSAQIGSVRAARLLNGEKLINGKGTK